MYIFVLETLDYNQMQEKTKLASTHIISICRSLFQFCYITFTTKWGWANCKTKLKTTDSNVFRETGLGLGIRASHKGIDGRHCGLSCNSDLPLLKTSSNFDRHFTKTILPRGVIFNIKPESQQHRHAASMHDKQVVSLMVNQHGPLPFTKNQSTDKTGWWRNPGGC